jgi:hypothetical protein
MPEIAENFDSHDLRLTSKWETVLQFIECSFQLPLLFASRSRKRIRKVSSVLLITGFTHVLMLLPGSGSHNGNFEKRRPQGLTQSFNPVILSNSS